MDIVGGRERGLYRGYIEGFARGIEGQMLLNSRHLNRLRGGTDSNHNRLRA